MRRGNDPMAAMPNSVERGALISKRSTSSVADKNKERNEGAVRNDRGNRTGSDAFVNHLKSSHFSERRSTAGI
jgi:hypothetical protein